MECQLCARHVVGTGRQKKVKYGLCLQVTHGGGAVYKNRSTNLPAKVVSTVTTQRWDSQGMERRCLSEGRKGWERGVPGLTAAAKDGRTLDNLVLE